MVSGLGLRAAVAAPGRAVCSRRPAQHDAGQARANAGILNGFGRTLGDGIIGLQALTLAMQAGAVPQDATLLRLPFPSFMIEQLYRAAGHIASVRRLSWADEKPGHLPEMAAGFAKIIDLRDFAFDPEFRGVAMIDFFLKRLGLNPNLIPTGGKRNTWLASCVAPNPPAGQSDYVLVCPIASMPMRCMPDLIHDAILSGLRAHTKRPVLTQATLPPEATLAGLCGLVASASLVISTDTAMVHLADAFSIPCLAFSQRTSRSGECVTTRSAARSTYRSICLPPLNSLAAMPITRRLKPLGSPKAIIARGWKKPYMKPSRTLTGMADVYATVAVAPTRALARQSDVSGAACNPRSACRLSGISTSARIRLSLYAWLRAVPADLA